MYIALLTLLKAMFRSVVSIKNILWFFMWL